MVLWWKRWMAVRPRVRLLIWAAAVLVAVVGVALAVVPTGVAQDPDDEYVPEPGYLDAPGDFGYPRSDDEVEGEQVDCTIDPGNSRCPIPPPYRIAKPTISPSTTGVNLQASYRRTTWALLSAHHYVFELHRSSTAAGVYTRSTSIWDGESPVNFNHVARNYYYKVRAKRCRMPNVESTCGDFGEFSSSVYIPRQASTLRLSLNITELTATYTARGTSYDEIDIAERDIGTSGNGETESESISGSGHKWTGDRGSEYRFRIRRCTDSGRTSCDSWSGWSGWKKVPVLPAPDPPLKPTLGRSITNLTVSYSASDSSHDKYEIERSTTRTGRFRAYRSGTDNSQKLNGVQRNYWYRLRLYRCTDDALKDCTGVSPWSDPVFVPNLPSPNPPPKPMLGRVATDLTVSYAATDSS